MTSAQRIFRTGQGSGPLRTRGFSSLAIALLAAALLVGGASSARLSSARLSAAEPKDTLTLAEIPFNGARAYEYLGALCALGPRISDSPAMKSQQAMLKRHFEKLGGKVHMQEFRVRHPVNGNAVPMANMVVEWHPERKQRILLCTHYDTRPFPDQDPREPRGKFLGANDGGSGTALLMELANNMAAIDGTLGVDFVFFDGEEFVYEEGRDPYFIGSEYFATNYAAKRGNARYRWGVLLDMIGDEDLQVYPDTLSMSWRDTKPLVDQIWGVAKRLGVSEFVANRRFEVRDDHVPLHDIGHIPCCDLIDFKYPAWHTRADTPERCSALSLAKVGWVVQEWLKQAVQAK